MKRLFGLIALSSMALTHAESLSPAQRKLVDEKLKSIQSMGADATVVTEVKAYNSSPPPGSKEMNNEAWKQLTVLDPFVRSFTKNALAQYLKAKKD